MTRVPLGDATRPRPGTPSPSPSNGGANAVDTLAVSPWVVRGYAFGCVFFGATAITSLVLAWLVHRGSIDGSFERGIPGPLQPLVLAVGFVLFGAMAIAFAYRWRATSRAALSLDAEGLWPAATPRREGLVRFDAIVDLRHRPLREELELLDAQGAVLLRVDHSLPAFAAVRELILRSMRAPADELVRSGASRRSRAAAVAQWIVWGFVFSIIVIVALDGRARTGPLFLLAATAMVAALAWQERRRARWIRWNDDELHVGLPFRSRKLLRTDIEAIGVDRNRENRLQLDVLISVRGETEPVRLYRFDVPTLTLARRLMAWHARRPAR